MFFSFPEDARWNDERGAVEFGVEISEYWGIVRQSSAYCRFLGKPWRVTSEICVP
jgi:hypothetical protein